VWNLYDRGKSCPTEELSFFLFQVFDLLFFTKFFVVLQQVPDPNPNPNFFFGFGSSQNIRIFFGFGSTTLVGSVSALLDAAQCVKEAPLFAVSPPLLLLLASFPGQNGGVGICPPG
jgi:hypothetical protein